MNEQYNSRIQEEGDSEAIGRKYILDDDEIPFEVRMKYIIKEYRKDQEKWAKLFFRAKNMEEKLSDHLSLSLNWLPHCSLRTKWIVSRAS